MTETKHLGELVKEYLDNPHHKGFKIPLEKVSVYEIIAGVPESNYAERESLGFFKGKYIDVIAKAVKMPEFIGDWCGPDFSNQNNGYVKENMPTKINEAKPTKGLMEYLKASNLLEKKRKALDKEENRLKNYGDA